MTERDDSGDVLGRKPAERLLATVKIVGALVALLWALEILDQVFLGQGLDAWGIRPRSLSGLFGILFSPFLHGGFLHLIANTPPFAVLGVLLLLRGAGQFAAVTATVVVGGGLGVWLTGAANSVHIGASGVVFGWFGYLVLIGFLERRFLPLLSSVAVAFLYGGIVWGVLPSSPHVSWQGHLFGLLAGLGAAWLGRPRRALAAGR